MKRSKPTSLTERLASLSEPVRLRILRLLEQHELSVGEVAAVVQLPQSTVSRHLKVLSDAGWPERRSEGTATLYRLVLDDLPPEQRALWLIVREQIPGTSELAEDARRLRAVLAERRTDSAAYFGRVAGEWDTIRNDLFGTGFTAQGLLALVPRSWTVADLGCGTGNAAELLAAHVDRVIAVDRSGPMLDAARKRLADFRNVEFVEGSVDGLPLPAASVDAAVCVLVLHHLDNPAAAVGEMRRIVKPGGVGLIVDMLEHDRQEYRHTMGHKKLGYTPAQITSLMTAAGFSGCRVTPLPSAAEARGPGLFAATGHAELQRKPHED